MKDTLWEKDIHSKTRHEYIRMNEFSSDQAKVGPRHGIGAAVKAGFQKHFSVRIAQKLSSRNAVTYQFQPVSSIDAIKSTKT